MTTEHDPIARAVIYRAAPSFFKEYVEMISRHENALKSARITGGKIPEWHETRTGRVLGKLHGKTIQKHRWVWETHHGTPIQPGFVIHHKNHNALDNDIENLELMSERDHIHHHRNYDALIINRAENVKKSVEARLTNGPVWNKGKKIIATCICVVCGIAFQRSGRLQGRLTKKGKQPVCSPKCQSVRKSSQVRLQTREKNGKLARSDK